MVDVIIPAYNAHDLIIDGLYSLSLQSYKGKMKVYIVDDCSIKDYKEIINQFKNKLDIHELKTPKNMGPGYARQYGLDNSNSEYIVFLDADDTFADAYAIENLLDCIKENKSDVVVSNFIEEIPGEKYTHYYNNIWMHGKIYNRNFLTNNNIRFNNSSKNEDTGFNTLVSLCSDNIYYLDAVTYIWKYNADSITRRNSNEFEFSGLEGFINNICWAVNEAINKKVDENKIAKVIYETIIEIFYNYIKFDYNIEICKWSKELKSLYLRYKDKISYNSRQDAIYSMVEKGIGLAGAEKILNNSINFDSFINLIE